MYAFMPQRQIKSKKTPAVIAYRTVFLFLGNCWPENRVNSQNTKPETANRQKAIAYDPMGTNLTIRLPNPNTTQPSTSNGTAYFLPFPSNIPSPPYDSRPIGKTTI